MTKTKYEAQQAADAAGIPLRRLLGWCERRVIRPTVPARGRGTRRLFTRRDIVVLRALAALQQVLGRHTALKRIAREITEEIDAGRGADVWARKGGEATLVVNLRVLWRQVDAELR